MIVPWNWAWPVSRAVVAVGKFHSSLGRRSVVGSPGMPVPVYVLITGLADSMLTITVAPAGMRANSRPIMPPVEPARFPATLKTCRALVPSPVKVAL
ncbi:hypothetical protein A6A07_12635 [Streptomyces sp. CB03911]|nr:hypothetical protein A6A07_12635 [Streptomyces sp. CB03911]